MSVLNSIMAEHDLRLVLLAAVICAFGALTTLNVSSRVSASRHRTLWLILLSVCAGATVWATHFIAMLAYMPGTDMMYDPALTTLSFAAGVVIMGSGFLLAIRGGRTLLHRIAGGVVVGVGVVVLHYIGMAALQMPGTMTYAPGLVLLSVLFSVVFGGASFAVEFGPPRSYGRPLATALMLVMIVSLHFTAMGAAHMQHDSHAGLLSGGVSRSMLATAVAVASISVLIIGMAGALVDQRVSSRLAAETDRFRTLAEGAFEGLIVNRNGNIIDANAAARRMLDLPDPATAAVATRWQDLLVGIPTTTLSTSEDTVEVTLRRPDGTQFPAEICRREMRLPDGGHGELCAIRDLTARKASEAHIAHLALHDPLTDLPNRRFFMELAHKTISQAHRTGDRFALLTVDLDDFKQVNDTHGHSAGDELIRIAAQRIASTVRDADVSSRFGGDEFAVLQSGASQPNQTVVLAQRLLEALAVPVSLEYGEVAITASIGIAFYPDDGTTVEELLRNADTAMYRAKADGKAMSRFFEPHMDSALLARRTLERGLRKAVSENTLSVAYQPIVDSRTRRAIGFEALARWEDDELGTVMPSDFIPVAEETGLIVPLGALVLRQACFDAMSWPAPLRVAVNLSAVQFRRKGLIEMVQSALLDSGLPGDRLELEVTETLLMDNRQEAVRQLNELRELGVRISMDDFGTGYSALSYLQCFPFDKIKIDRVFVTDLATNAQNASIVRAVAAMGRSLQMRVVAEGVETDNEADILMGLDCDEIQGYLISKPLPSAEVHAFLAARPETALVHALP